MHTTPRPSCTARLSRRSRSCRKCKTPRWRLKRTEGQPSGVRLCVASTVGTRPISSHHGRTSTEHTCSSHQHHANKGLNHDVFVNSPALACRSRRAVPSTAGCVTASNVAPEVTPGEANRAEETRPVGVPGVSDARGWGSRRLPRRARPKTMLVRTFTAALSAVLPRFLTLRAGARSLPASRPWPANVEIAVPLTVVTSTVKAHV